MFKGAISALVLPFKDGKIDEEAYRAFIEWQIEQGIDGLLPCGTTGESATLSHEEHERAIRICIEQTNKRVPVIAGSGSNNTTEAIRLTKFAKEVGADAALMITPYYNKPTQEGLYRHFKAVTDAVSIPMYAYNVPGRTGCNMAAETMVRLYNDVADIKGVKEASGNILQMARILENVDEDFVMLSGEDSLILPALSLGAKGVISVTSNVMPKEMSDLCDAWFAGDVAEARRLYYYLEPLSRAMFVETNPMPAKTALHFMGKMNEEFRLPLCEMQEHTRADLKELVQKMNLIK